MRVNDILQKAIVYTYCKQLYNTDEVDVLKDYKILIRQKRQEKGISQNQLAKLVGISQPYMNQIETGVRNPTLPTLMKICEILDISLFGKEDEETG